MWQRSRTPARQKLRAVLGIVLACAFGGFAATAAADTPTLPADAPLAWGDPTYQSPLENLASTIASKVANRSVTVRCEGDFDWTTLAVQGSFDPQVELGYVEARFYSSGAVASISGFTELSPVVCLALQQFAIATTKPTKCSSPVTTSSTNIEVRTSRRHVRKQVVRVVHGVRRKVWVKVWKPVSVRVPVTTSTTTEGPAEACYGSSGLERNPQDVAYWNDYDRYAMGLLTLAHESIHLGGYVGGSFPNGLQAGYPDAEARAQCYGMQWMPYVAEQLGASPDDALAIARFAYSQIYPWYRTGAPAYWSSECRPGGALDLHTVGATIWS
jgi:hypothetical protein